MKTLMDLIQHFQRGALAPQQGILSSPQQQGGLAGILNSAKQEHNFQNWITQLPWYKEFLMQHGEPPDLNSPDYDYRAAWRAGITPERYAPDNNRFHWPSITPTGQELKATNHPTAWMEDYMRITGRDPMVDSQSGGSKLTPEQVRLLSDALIGRYK